MHKKYLYIVVCLLLLISTSCESTKIEIETNYYEVELINEHEIYLTFNVSLSCFHYLKGESLYLTLSDNSFADLSIENGLAIKANEESKTVTFSLADYFEADAIEGFYNSIIDKGDLEEDLFIHIYFDDMTYTGDSLICSDNADYYKYRVTNEKPRTNIRKLEQVKDDVCQSILQRIDERFQMLDYEIIEGKYYYMINDWNCNMVLDFELPDYVYPIYYKDDVQEYLGLFVYQDNLIAWDYDLYSQVRIIRYRTNETNRVANSFVVGRIDGFEFVQDNSSFEVLYTFDVERYLKKHGLFDVYSIDSKLWDLLTFKLSADN